MVTIEEVVGRQFTVIGQGRWRTTKEHGSLWLDTEKQVYYWNSKGEWGTVRDWSERYGSLTNHNASAFAGGL